MQMDRYFWISLARIVGLVIAGGIFLVGLDRVIDAFLTKEQFLIGIGILVIGGGVYATGFLAWALVGLASDIAGELRSKAEEHVSSW